VAKLALLLAGGSCASRMELGVFLWHLTTGVSAFPPSVFSYAPHATCTHPPPFFSPQRHALYIFNVDGGDSIDLKVVSVRPYLDSVPTSNHKFGCMRLTDRRIYFAWEDARRRDVPLYKDEADTRPEPSATSTAEPSQEAWANPKFGGHSPSP